jgi:UDP-glucose 4-epimerase
VRVLDDLSTGYRTNVHDAAELHTASIADLDAVTTAMDGIETVFHVAALRAVQRSVESPLATDDVNVHGTLTILEAARRARVTRVVCASSSSVYGGAEQMPTPETATLIPRSPYAVSKLTGEHYARVFSELYGLETVSLRYFNVYGPRQRPDSQYAAVIPLFIDALRSGRPPIVHGDGKQSRDFTFVSDTVEATIAASTAPASACSGRSSNVASGTSYTLLDILDILGGVHGVVPTPEHAPPREGDVRHTKADPTAARRDLDFECRISFEAGLARTVDALGV